MDSISEEKSIVRKILVKLPTRDVVRCRCVCRRWRRIVAEPSFRALHGSVRGGGGCGDGDVQAQTLLVYEIRSSATVDMLVLNSPSSRKLMCRVTDLFTVAGYSPANPCNGFLLFAPRIHDWPLCVCNPVTGEKLLLSEAPSVQHEVSYALGFSPSTPRYKLFRLYFPPNGCYMDVRTLGGGGDQLWRRHPDPLQCRAISAPSPALVDGKIYLTCGEGILVMDVATEAHYTYPLPMYEGENVAFELSGRLCVAVHVIAQRKLYFWVLHLDQDKKDGTPLLDWELRYTFHMDHSGNNNGGENQPRGVGFNDRSGVLCYRMSDRLYRYNTTKNDHHHKVGALLKWDSIT